MARHIYSETSSGLLYVCATTKTGSTSSVVTFHSADGGTSWSVPETFLSGLQPVTGSFVSCRIDEAGLIAVYADATDSQVKLVRSAP
ncbi:MAG: hypothetical protein KAI47_28425 [Deltaproteobacteria bacterium]|nr:hypothetical protein [Deltaproteobacteria bacterium]